MLLFGKQDVVIVHGPQHESLGIQAAVQMAYFVVQVRRRAGPGTAGVANLVAALDELPRTHQDFVQVGIKGSEAKIVHQAHDLAHAAVVLLGRPFHDAVSGGIDRRAARRVQIDPAVHGHSLRYGVAAHAKAAGHLLGIYRPAGWDGAQHQALFKRGLAGGVDALGQGTFWFRAQADQQFNVLEFVAQGQQRQRLFFHLALQLAPFALQGRTFRQNRRPLCFQYGELGVQIGDSAVERMNRD